ncbi:hypothetical protein E2C01_014884 [Portunus trituberculatus]|uniref:Uncharacterized protein n=1 Tax=Portunus trituberculatus TaxID=210409 RepID=A0A5B7DJV5_PORTR|nr:hypothetical protein [Portunus trituberculatus]
MSCGAVIAKKSHRELESLRVSLGDAVFSRQHGVGQNWEESSSAEEPQINYDYFVQPTPDTTRPLPIAGRRTFNPRISDIDSPLADTSIRDSDTTDKNLGARKEEILQYTKTNPSHTQASTELYQEDQVWPNEDPFSVFYDSMFPEMESVIPEEETRKSIPIISPKATQKSTSTTNDPDSTIEASADTTPTTLLGETQLPTTAPVLLSSSSMQSTPSSHIPSLLNTSFDSTRFEKLITRMSLVLEKFDVVSKLGLPDKAFKMNLTDLVSKFDIDDVDYIVDLVEAASNLNLKDLASKMNIGHVNGARLQQVQVSLSHLLEYIMSLESVKHATKELGINETTVNGVLDRVEASARQVVDDGNGGKLLLLPLFDTVSLNVVQSLGFTVLIFFLLLSAYSYISLKPVTIARDGSERPPGSLIPRPSELNPDSNPHWRTALDAAEAVDSPWEHERHHHQEQGQRETVATGRPIPVPDPAALHRLGHHASSHLRTRPQQTNPHRGPLIVPVNFRSDHHIKHFPVSTQQTGHSQPVPPYEPDHYDKHRHFASYEDDDQYEDQDKDRESYKLNRFLRHITSKVGALTGAQVAAWGAGTRGPCCLVSSEPSVTDSLQ